ncbi:8433_t:CDS:2 [Gigaspora margarita]|uniref:8433_t:CDS:1 n=1 Tax=Gigaspora margarita TaxID=4874 RepID=A0ABN7UCK3_GIGMA|nr:8433_t:CDS:2 [Gigaspora margarita]
MNKEQLKKLLNRNKELTYVKINSFSGKNEDDHIEGLKAFARTTIANNWSKKRILKIVSDYYQGLYRNVKVDAYIAKFKYLVARVYPEEKLADSYIIQIFMSSFKANP